MSERMRPVLHTEDGLDHEFGVLYPMLGETTRTADCAELVVDSHQETTVPGLFAIGDVVRGLNQISVAAALGCAIIFPKVNDFETKP